jgi:hypothetical protein
MVLSFAPLKVEVVGTFLLIDSILPSVIVNIKLNARRPCQRDQEVRGILGEGAGHHGIS